MAARACPGAAEGSKWPFELAPEPPNARKVLLENAAIDNMVAPLPLLAPGGFKFRARLLLGPRGNPRNREESLGKSGKLFEMSFSGNARQTDN